MIEKLLALAATPGGQLLLTAILEAHGLTDEKLAALVVALPDHKPPPKPEEPSNIVIKHGVL